MDVSKVLFIAAGAFAGLGGMRQKNPVGFITNVEKQTSGADYRQIGTEDLIDYGLIPELVGRFSAIVSLSPLGKEDLIRVMVEPEDSVLKNYQEYFRSFGTELIVESPALEKIASLALARKTGARGLRSILEDVFRPYIFTMAAEKSKHSTIVIGEAFFSSHKESEEPVSQKILEGI